ncbi:MAG: DUF255 domain-containing protein [Planctomycetes bacterium]|nr:DUF255 domain-containing protein [Planctomycetota bacterium]
MSTRVSRISLLVALLGALGASAVCAQQSTTVPATAGTADGPYAIRATPLTVELSQDGTDATLYTGMLGTKAKVMLVCEGPNSSLALNIDLDGDGEEDWIATAEPQQVQQRGRKFSVWRFENSLERGPTRLTPMAQLPDGADVPTLQFQPTVVGNLYGEARLGDTPIKVMVCDLDLDGVIGSHDDGWVLHTAADMDALLGGARPKQFSVYSLIEAYEPCFLPDGRVVRLDGVTAAGISLKTKKGGDDLESYLHRRTERVNAKWKERFEGELKDMIASRGEAGRPLATKPIAWLHALSLDEALERARKENKPLLVDFETDWCIWCKVLDTLTYPDAEVAAYVEANFIPVKVNAELLVEDLTGRYEVRGYPGMPVIAPDGEKIDALSGFQPPSAFLESLRKAREAFEKH